MSASDLKVIIIGAGTGGMCLAHGLRRAGVDVSVHERERTRTGGLNGYRVGISPNGARALKSCLDPDLFATFVATTAASYDHMTMYTEQYSELLDVAFADFASTGDGAEDKEYNVSRMTLRQVLFTGMDDVITFDHDYTGYTQHPDGTVTAHFANGEAVTGDLVVGADGAQSRVRRQYLPHATQTETGLVAIAGKAPLTDETAAMLPSRARDGFAMYFGRRGELAVTHPMRVPWDGAVEGTGAPRAGIGSSDAELIERWPGLRYDNTVDYVSWGVNFSRTLAPADALTRQGSDLYDTVLELTPGWHPSWRELVGRSDPGAAIALSIRTSDPVPPWRPTSVTLLGDAIHTMTPGRGAGANTALRDARELRDRLLRVRDGELGVVEAVGAYEELMRTYSALAVRESLEFMTDNPTLRRPVIGPVSVLAQRGSMRLVNRIPAAKRRMARSMQKVRDSELV